jgi:excisionase family DNA binding protein
MIDLEPIRHDDTDQLLTVAEVAGRIGTTEKTVRRWIHSGELSASRFGTRIGYRIRQADYEAFLRRRRLREAIVQEVLGQSGAA